MAEQSLKREREEADADQLASFHQRPSDAQKSKAEGEKSSAAAKRWTPDQDEALKKAVEEIGAKNWKVIAERVPGRNHAQCLQRWNKVLKPGLVKGHWSFEEDSILERMVLQGCHSWAEVSAAIPGRTAKQCRERWRNHLDPSINKGPFTPEEDETLQSAYEKLGNRWTQIAELLPGRTEDAVKTRWKALNPNRKANNRPGRPKLIPGMPSSKSRSTSPPTPADMVSSMCTPTHTSMGMEAGMQPMYAQTPPVPSTIYTPITGTHPMDPSMIAGSSAHAAVATSSEQSELPEPITDPIAGEDGKGLVDSGDAYILKELLRSHSNSLLSFGSSRGLGSLSDMTAEELLASGELEELFRQVSVHHKGEASDSGRKSVSELVDSFQRSMGSLPNGTDRQMLENIMRDLHESSIGDVHNDPDLLSLPRHGRGPILSTTEEDTSVAPLDSSEEHLMGMMTAFRQGVRYQTE